MKYSLSLILFLLFLVPHGRCQVIQLPQDSVIEYDGQFFMPYAEGVKEKVLAFDPGVARMKPSQVSILKKKLNQCLSLFYNDSAFHTMNGLKVVFREEIFPMDGTNEMVRWIPSSIEIGIFTTLARDSMPYWESVSDASVILHFNNPKKLVGPAVINDIYIEPLETN